MRFLLPILVVTPAIAGTSKAEDNARTVLDAQIAAIRSNDATQRALLPLATDDRGSIRRPLEVP